MQLNYFSPEEFIRGGTQWLPRMNPRWLVMIDVLRHEDRRKIRISPDPGALGRTDRSRSTSQHYAGEGRLCNAGDVLPQSVTDPETAERFYLRAKNLGFRGIGFYLGGASGPRFHLDERDDREPGYPATWGRVPAEDGKTVLRVSINDAIEWYESRAGRA